MKNLVSIVSAMVSYVLFAVEYVSYLISVLRVVVFVEPQIPITIDRWM